MNECRFRPLVVISGPTATGKSDLSIALAQKIGGEIISADSMQVYREMDIGTAKILPEQMQGIPHHLLDVLDPSESFDAVRFQQLAKKAIEEIDDRGHIPIVTGGTGFYIHALIYDTVFSNHDEAQTYRAGLVRIGEEPGGELRLHEMLRKVDPSTAEAIHPNNKKRIIRALEFYHETGQPISSHNQEQRKRPSPYRFAHFVLTDDRDALYRRIDDRVDRMMKEGLLEEVIRLREKGFTPDMVSMQGIGYRQILRHLEGEYPLEEAVRLIKRDSRHYAKRQLTWFRRENDIIWMDRQQFAGQDEMVSFICGVLKEKKIPGEEKKL